MWQEKDSAWYLSYLKEQDDPEYFEYPKNFSLHTAEEEFSEMVVKLAKVWQLQLDPNEDIIKGNQDCTFHGLLRVPEKYYISANPEQEDAWLKFSNFGDMVALEDNDARLSPEGLKVIAAALEDNGYVFIPDNILAEKYTGPWLKAQHPPFNWSARFFDYS